eukprot:COSAG01_NODE_555_length_15533_cov_35.243310_9_plen_125_part_00
MLLFRGCLLSCRGPTHAQEPDPRLKFQGLLYPTSYWEARTNRAMNLICCAAKRSGARARARAHIHRELNCMHSGTVSMQCMPRGRRRAGLRRPAAAAHRGRRVLQILAQPTPDLAGSRCYETMT